MRRTSSNTASAIDSACFWIIGSALPREVIAKTPNTPATAALTTTMKTINSTSERPRWAAALPVDIARFGLDDDLPRRVARDSARQGDRLRPARPAEPVEREIAGGRQRHAARRAGSEGAPGCRMSQRGRAAGCGARAHVARRHAHEDGRAAPGDRDLLRIAHYSDRLVRKPARSEGVDAREP